MRLLHLSDLHLGKYVLEAPMLDDQREFLAGTAAYAAAHRMDGVLLAGDVYDRSVPPVPRRQTRCAKCSHKGTASRRQRGPCGGESPPQPFSDRLAATSDGCGR